MHETLLQVEHLIERRRWSEARRLLARVFHEAPGDPDAHCCAAHVADGEGDGKAAREHVQRALAVAPRHFVARLLRFEHLVDDRRYAEAEELVLDLLREAPGDVDLLTQYARLMLVTMHLDKSRELLREALRREPGHHHARTLSVLEATIEGDCALAEGRLAELLREDPEGERTAYLLFAVLIDRHRLREALRVGQELLRKNPHNPKLIDALVELRALTHPLSLPAYPAIRFGWAGSAAVWALAIATMMVLGRVAPTWAGGFVVAYLAYCIYTWVYRTPLRRWIARRGIRGA